jgi:hypothetical protein
MLNFVLAAARSTFHGISARAARLNRTPQRVTDALLTSCADRQKSPRLSHSSVAIVWPGQDLLTLC